MPKALFLEMREQNELVHVRYDDPIHEGMENYLRYAQTIRKLKRITLENSCEYSIASIATGTFANSELKRLIGLGYKYACFWPDGSVPTDGDFEKELLEYCKHLDTLDTKWMVIGHIIDRSAEKGVFPYLHEQTIVINLETWNSVHYGDEPIDLFDKTDRITSSLPSFITADEHIHDDYTPMWIAPANKGKVDMEFREGAWNRIIVKALNMGFVVHNFPHHLRKMKECYYLEDHQQETNEWLFSDDYYMQSDEFYDKMKHDMKQSGQADKAPLFSLKRQTENIVYITNTESVPQFDFLVDFLGVDINTFVMPCSGFNQFEFMLQHFDSLKHVVFYDANRNSIAWMKHLINNWDGESDLYEFIDEYLATLSNKISIIYETDYVKSFLDNTTKEQRIELFNRLKNEDVQYLHVDVMRDWNNIVSAVPEDTNVLINLTNIWRYEGNFINNTLLECDNAFFGLMEGLVEKSTNVLFKGDTPKGIYVDCVNISSRGGFI